MMLLIALLAWSTTARACDVCGAAGMGIGLLTDYKRNFVRLGYFYNAFEAAPSIGYQVSDRFHQGTLSVRFGIGDRVRLVGDLPLRSNWRYSALEEAPQQQTGLGDARILGYYVPFNRSIGAQHRLYWEVGGGFSLPTGLHDPDIHDRNLPENFNTGMGSMGYVLQTNVILTRQQWGLVANLTYQLNGPTARGYRFGNLGSAQLTGFREIPVKKVQLVPNVGFSLEHIGVDHYANGRVVSGTGGIGGFLTAAFNIKTNTWLAGVSASLPVFDNYGGGEIDATLRLGGQVSYLF